MPHTLSLFRDLQHHKRLYERRHPMFERNRFAKIVFGLIAVFWALYVAFIGFTLPSILEGEYPGMEPYRALNGGMFVLLCIDFWLRFPVQQTPMQELRPYILLPIGKRLIINSFIVRRMFSPYNLFWFCGLVPFACLTLFRTCDAVGLIGFWIGWWLLFVLNSLFYLFCRTLITHKIGWSLFPALFYALLAVWLFKIDAPSLKQLCIHFGDGLIHGHPLAYLIIIASIAVCFFANQQLQLKLLYVELSKEENVPLKHAKEFSFLERYGEIGEYLKLEIKCALRCRNVKLRFIQGIFFILFFNAMLTFSDIYNGFFMQNFICIYCFATLGSLTLVQIMGYEGNYLDGLMSRPESILALLRAKYYFHCLLMLLPLLLMLLPLAMGKVSWLMVLAYLFLTTGPIYFVYFQMAVYNKQTIPLNEKFMGRGKANTNWQWLVALSAMLLPILLNKVLGLLIGDVAAQSVLLAIGLAFTLTCHVWMRSVYRRFMARRYENMAGFREG